MPTSAPRRSLRWLVPTVTACAMLQTAPCAAADRMMPDWRVQLHKLAPMAWQPRNMAKPVLVDSTLLVGAANGLHALDAQTGARRWHAKTSEAVAGAPSVVAGKVYVVTRAGRIRAVNFATGKAVWPKPTEVGSVVHAKPATDSKRLFLLANPAVVCAVRLRDGKVLWRYSTPVTRDFLVEGHGAPAVHRGVVFAGLSTGNLVALSSRDGGVVWERRLGAKRSGPYVDIDNTPVIGRVGEESALFVTSHNDGLYALRSSNGGLLWRYRSQGLGQPLLAGGRVYSVSPAGALHIVDAKTGRRVLGRKLAGRPSGQVVLAAERLLIPTAGGLQIVDRQTGHTIWHVVDEYGFGAAPLVRGDVVWALANNGTAWRLVMR